MFKGRNSKDKGTPLFATIWGNVTHYAKFPMEIPYAVENTLLRFSKAVRRFHQKMSVEQINTARNALSKGEDIREEMLLVVGPHVSWEDFLTPAPMCVCLLGELMVIATKADFTLENSPPRDGFKLMRWPSSFRASLMQVANCGYDAFSEAHRSMDQIRLLSLNVPRHLLDAVKILLKGTDEEIEDMLPRPLQAIQKVADQGMLLATSVEAKFSDVMSLTAELLESCVGARGKYETDLKETEVALAIARENKITAEEWKELSTKAYNELEKSVKDAEKAYYKAMDSMPTGWQIIGMNVVEGIGDAFTTVLSGVSRAVTRGLGTPSGSKKPSGSKNAQPASRISLDDGTIKAYQAAVLLKTYTDTLQDATILEGTLRKNLRQHEDKVMYAERQYLNILGQAGQKGMNLVNDRVIGLCETGIQVCSDIRKLQRNFQVNSGLETDLVERILSLHDDVVALEVEGKTVL